MKRRRKPTLLTLLLAILTVLASGGSAETATSDAELETFLRRARVVEARDINTGITRPLKLTLEYQGRTMAAAFKTVDVRKRGRHVERGFPPAIEFTDRHAYERAAFLVDRQLGLGMVPVAVLREWAGKRGAAIVWVPDAINEDQLRVRGLEPPDPTVLAHQRHVMRVFDALILNTDRNLTNQLITPEDWKLHLIDHSRSFRQSHQLPEAFLKQPVKLPRELLARLEALDEPSLGREVRDLIGRPRVRSLLARRDAILEKVEEDRRRFGDAFVFHFDSEP